MRVLLACLGISIACGIPASATASPAASTPGVSETPRSVALAGADLAVAGGSPLAGGSVADLARLGEPAVLSAGAVSSRGGFSAVALTGGAGVGEFGLAGMVARRERGDLHQGIIGVEGGLPTGAVPGLSMGLGLKAVTESLGTDQAAGFAMDAGMSGRFAMPWPGIELSVAAAVTDVLGSLSWDSGLKEEIPYRSRLGAGVFRGPLEVLFGWDLLHGSDGGMSVYSGGVEYGFQGLPGGLSAVARAGWRGHPGTTCAGFGLLRGPASFEYALASSSLGVVHSLSFEWRFPGAGREALGPGRRPGPGARARRASARDAEVVPERDVLVLDNPYRTVALAIRVPADETTRGWTVLVAAPDGAVVWETSGEGSPPRVVTWTGTSVAGEPVASGSYVCRLLLRGAAAPDYLSPGSAIRVVRPAMPPTSSRTTFDGFDVPDAAAGGGR